MPEHVPNTVLWNKHLEPPHNETTVPDTRGGRISGDALIAEGTGWDWAPLPPEPEPGLAAEPVEYVPVDKTGDDKGEDAKSKPKPSAGKSGSAKES